MSKVVESYETTQGIVYGGVSKNEFCLKWIINDFKTILKHNTLLQWQDKFVTTRLPLPVVVTDQDQIPAPKKYSDYSWKIALEPTQRIKNGKKYLNISFAPQKLKKLKSWVGVIQLESFIDDAIKASVMVNTAGITSDGNGTDYCRISELTIVNFLELSSQLESVSLDDGAVAIYIKIIFFSKQNYETSSCMYMLVPVDTRTKEHIDRLCKDFERVTLQELEPRDFKIITVDDRREFLVHRSVLKARSSKFNTMLQSEFREKTEGVVEVANMSAKTMRILLTYIYTGEVLTAELQTAGEIVDLANAAKHYFLEPLLNACGDLMIHKIDMSNAYELIEWANRLNLTNTNKQEIIKFIKIRWKMNDSTENVLVSKLKLNMFSEQVGNPPNRHSVEKVLVDVIFSRF